MTDPQMAGVRIYIRAQAIKENYQKLCQLYPQTQHGAVVKANGYSMGAETLAQILEQAGCQKFFVARPSEAFALRKTLSPTAQIYVFHGHETEMIAAYQHHRLIPVLHSIDSLQRCLDATKNSPDPLTIAIKINTGMNRLGIDPEELATVHWPEIHRVFKIDSVHSHLACGRNPDHPLNAKQFQLFEQLHRTYFPGIAKGLSASCQVVLPDKYCLEITRQGLNLLGAYPPNELPNNPFSFSLKVQAKILQIRQLKKGESVGYEATYTAPQDVKVATISMGYADGLPLSLKNNSIAFKVAGYRAPLIGKVSMDLATLDVSAVPQQLLNVNSWVDVFDDNMSLYELAEAAKSSMHDIILGLGPRCERIVV